MDKNKAFDLFKKLNYDIEDEKDGKNYRYFHPLRVLKSATGIAKSENFDIQINHNCLFLLALFHDIGRNETLVNKCKLDIEKHHENNIVIFEKNIISLLDDASDKEKMMEIVTDFSEKNYKLLESQIASDADNLDEIGILNFWRMAVYAGKHNQDVREIVDFYYNFDQKDKHDKMAKKLFLKSSKIIADDKLHEMDEIMKQFKESALSGTDNLLM